MFARTSSRRTLARVVPGGADRSGAMAVTMSLIMLAVVGLAALAIDGASAISAHTKLDFAADVGALAALRSAAAAYVKDPKTDLRLAEIAGEQRFIAQAGGIAGVSSVPVVAAHVQRDGLLFSASVTYSAVYNTQIAGALQSFNAGVGNFATLPLGGSASAQETAGAYVDIYVLMDVSNSMAIGATQDARNELIQKTTQYPLTGAWNWTSCAFVCHIKQPNANGFNSNLATTMLWQRHSLLRFALIF